MTELQMGLIGLGVAAVFGVFGYNKWQEMRQRKLAEAVLKPHHEDVLLAKGGKTEPEAVPAVQVERSEPEIRIEASEPGTRSYPRPGSLPSTSSAGSRSSRSCS